MDQRLYDALRGRWDEVAKFLLGAVAIQRAGRRPNSEWRALTAQDIVAETFRRALDERTWNETHYPDVRDYLLSVAKSIAGDAMRTKSAQAERGAARDHDPSADLVDQESELAAKELKNTVVLVLAGDHEPALMRQILECFEAGITMPSDVAEMLERPRHDVEVTIRRLKRRAREAVKENSK